MRNTASVAALMSVFLWTGGALAAPKAAPKAAAPPTAEAVNGAELQADKGKQAKPKGVDPVMLKAQVLLQRARFSPGTIDGRGGSNTDKALAAFEQAQGLQPDGKLDPEAWAKLKAVSADPIVQDYTIAPEDVKGPFTQDIPNKMEEMASLPRLGYRNARELLAAKFHVTEGLLADLNPGKDLEQAGTTIVVPLVRGKDQADKGKVEKVEVDKAGKAVRAFDGAGTLLAYYPASIGSAEKPAPTGTHKVQAVAVNPTYTYNPDYKFKGVKTNKKFEIKPGPNNPVGTVWIDLDVESYGIHGTPEPEKVGKSYSHGCIRLTNWDAEELAAMVKKGTVVDFREGT